MLSLDKDLLAEPWASTVLIIPMMPELSDVSLTIVLFPPKIGEISLK